MKYIIKAILTLSITQLMIGCDKNAVLGREPDGGNPVEIFNTYWHDMNTHYALFAEYGVDWNSIYSVYRHSINERTTQDSLWNIFKEINLTIGDSHTGAYDPHKRRSTPISNKRLMSYHSPGGVDFLLEHDVQQINTHMRWGKVEDSNIGYLYIDTFGDECSPQNIAALVEKVATCDAFIIDLRDNQGGLSFNSFTLSSYFTDNRDPVLYFSVKSGPGKDEFSPWSTQINYHRANNMADRPVVVLTSRVTMSAAEWCLLGFKTSPNVTHIGDTTRGALSTISRSRYLPNGWKYTYSIQQTRLPNGSSPEAIGCIPDHYITNENAWKLEFGSLTDSMMIYSIEYLKTKI